MYKKKLENLEAGKVLAKPVASTEGVVFLNKGVALKENYINKLKEKNVPAVFIKDREIPAVDEPTVISQKTRKKTVLAVKNCMQAVRNHNKLDIKDVSNAANSLIDELQQNKDALVHLNDIRAYNEYTFGHSIDVAILSLMTAMKLNYNQLELKKLAIGTLLHDIGKTKIDEDILMKPGQLTGQEFAEVKKHANIGYNILRNNEEVSIISAHVAYQHHERYNGSGYPRGLKEEQILEIAQIAAVADAYDAITTDRVYKEALPPYKAIQIIKEERDKGKWNSRVVKQFLKNIPAYPVGSIVKLSNGQIGIVIKLDKYNKYEPVVRLIKEKNGEKIDALIEINLSKRKDLEIASVIKAN
ncbi:HD-GYP domain-containing protein [Fuchsiella alkaliacetigena]|uniref:HD-GYP domain-containing protein n=1 Tax=Fuchsiella alkaliacetigena TaxID=957042 RepID=UPI00200AB090|nr:HD-GYP domain-containing protein [Fuchsiella alkaliacetigena]MCK8823631.1 HD-GYP domain-containing protein [Fuchsiella alkaliacetigena]